MSVSLLPNHLSTMDAKPQKPFRPLRVYGDENSHPKPFPNKTIHSRNKSSPSLSTLASNGVSNLAPKRSAFGDVSNTFQRNKSLVKDDLSVSAKAMAKDEAKPAGAFLRPAQRPLKDVSNVVKAAAPASKPFVTTDKLQTVVTRKAIPKLSTAANTTVLPPRTETALVPKDSTRNSWNADLAHKQIDDSQQRCHVKQTQNSEDAPALPDTLLEGVTQIQLNSKLPDPQINLIANVQPPSLPAPALEKMVATEGVADTGSKEAERLTDAIRKASITAIDPVLKLSHPVVEPAPLVQPSEPKLQSSINGATSTKTTVSAHENEHYWEEEEDLENYEEEGYVTARSGRSRVDNLTGNATTTLMPRQSLKARNEVAAARELVESLKTIEDYEDEAADTSMVAEYGDEIFEYLREMEEKMQPNAHYMNYQTEIQWSMRAVLMDWIVQVHTRFNLLPETLFLTTNYIDRFLSAKIVSLNKLQLVGATALFVAAKYEEINCPSVSEIVYMVDNGYTVDEVLKAERFMLSMLQFELGWPGPMSFLRRISKADDYDLETRTLAKYLLEVTIMDERFLGCPPSFTAAGAHCLARQLLKKGHWLIYECCTEPMKHHAAVYEKYQDKRYKYASRYVKQEIQRGFQVHDAASEYTAPVLSYFDHTPWAPEYVHLPWQ